MSEHYEDTHVILADRFDQIVWSEISHDSEEVAATKQRAATIIDQNFVHVVDDIFQTLYQYSPMRSAVTGEAMRRNAMYLDSLRGSFDYEMLRDVCKLDDFASCVGTIELVNKMFDEIEQAPVVIVLMAKQSDGSASQQETDELLGIIDRIIKKAARQARSVVVLFQQAMSNYGINTKEMSNVPFDRRKKAIKTLADKPKLKNISTLVGKMRRVLSKHKKDKSRYVREEIVDITASAQAQQQIPAEFMAMKSQKSDWRRRFVSGQLVTYEMEGDEGLGKGSMVVCIDKSGSMTGEPDDWASAVAFVLMQEAKRDRRSFNFCAFDEGILFEKTYDGAKYTAKDIQELTEIGAGGLTDFEPPLRHALSVISSDKKLRDADIVFITDGQSRISDELIADFNAQKEKQRVSLFTILIDLNGNFVGEADMLGKLKQISDGFFRLSDIRDDRQMSKLFHDIVNKTTI